MTSNLKSSVPIQSCFEADAEQDFKIRWDLRVCDENANRKLRVMDEKCHRTGIAFQTILSLTYFILSIYLQKPLSSIYLSAFVGNVYFVAIVWNGVCLWLLFCSFFIKFLDYPFRDKFPLLFVVCHYPSIVIRCTAYIFVRVTMNVGEISLEAEQLSFVLYLFVVETFFLVSTRVSFWLGAPVYFIGLLSAVITILSKHVLADLWVLLSGFCFCAIFYYARSTAVYAFFCNLIRKRLIKLSKIKAVEQNEAQVAQELEETKAKAIVFGQLAHDIGSPLTALSMAFELLEGDFSSNPQMSPLGRMSSQEQEEEQREAFEAINAAIAAITVLRQSMLDYVKKATGALIKPSLEPVDLKQLVSKKAFRILQQLVRSKPAVKAAWSIDPSLQNIKILSSENWLLDMLLNYVSNAVKFTEKGLIELIVSRRQASIIHEDALVVVFEVRDSGCGIPENNSANLFAAFGQLQSNKGGTGLGLVAVKEKATLLGGDAGFYNNDGKPGATFYFTVPFDVAFSRVARPQFASFNSSISAEGRCSQPRSSFSAVGGSLGSSMLPANFQTIGSNACSVVSGVIPASFRSIHSSPLGRSHGHDSNHSSFSSIIKHSQKSSPLRTNQKWFLFPESSPKMGSARSLLATQMSPKTGDLSFWNGKSLSKPPLSPLAKSMQKVLPSPVENTTKGGWCPAQPGLQQPTTDTNEEADATCKTKVANSLLESLDSSAAQVKAMETYFTKPDFSKQGSGNLELRNFSRRQSTSKSGTENTDKVSEAYLMKPIFSRHESANLEQRNRSRKGSTTKRSTDKSAKREFGRFKVPELYVGLDKKLSKSVGSSELVVMVVDDMPVLLTLYARILKKSGIKSVLEATSGETCLDMLFGKPRKDVDIILMDDQMSGLRGPEVVLKIVKTCEIEKRPCPSIYICSGSSPDALNDEFPDLKQCVKKILQKPIGLREIKKILLCETNEDSLRYQSFRARENTEIREILCATGLEKNLRGKLFELNTGFLLHNQLQAEYMRKELDDELENDSALLKPASPRKRYSNNKFLFSSVDVRSERASQQDGL